MGYSQSKKLSQTEKKLQSLKLQLYGKPENLVSSINHSSNTLTYPDIIKTTDPHYLKKDLTKIFLLTILAIGVELTVYFSESHGLLNF